MVTVAVTVAATIMVRDVLRRTLTNPSLHKVQVLAFLVDEYWKPGISIRVSDIVFHIRESRGIKISDKTMHTLLDSFVNDGVLTLSKPMHEKTYSINEEIDVEDLRNAVLTTVGIRSWVESEKSSPKGEPQSGPSSAGRQKRSPRR